jgi:hypothetical protein
MRFRFEHGGRSGIRDPEAFGFALDQYVEDHGRFGDLLVDFAATNDQPGELFRAKHVLLNDLSNAIGDARERARGAARVDLAGAYSALAARYWAEAEAMLLARTAPPKRRRRRGSSSI